MNRLIARFLQPALIMQDGQALPWMVFMMVLFLGMGGITVDLGRGYVCYRELQASTDAAALAGAYALSQSGATSASVRAAAAAESSVSNGANVNPNLPNTTISTTLKCLAEVTSFGVPCGSSSTGSNAVSVVQTSTIPTFFIQAIAFFGVKSARSLTLTTMSQAAMAGGGNQQWNVALVVDTTASMNSYDSDKNCSNTRIACALSGMRTLIGSLSPCTGSTASQGSRCASFDTVSLFSFPNIQANTANNDTSCGSSNPASMPYTAPAAGAAWTATNFSSKNATYQITGYENDYSSNYQANGGLNTSSGLGIAAGASKNRNCSGLQAPGGQGTYYAGAIYAAQSSLVAQQAANPGSKNALIILSDGDASSTRFAGGIKSNGATYPSTVDQCTQGVNAANFATSQGTTVYVVAYGASSSGCSTDKGGYAISPCNALKGMASSPGTFYSDSSASTGGGACTSSVNNITGLDNIFKSIYNNLTQVRLIPNSWNTIGT